MAGTFGWLMHHRRLARDYETHPWRSEAVIHIAMIDLIGRRLTRESTPNWRDKPSLKERSIQARFGQARFGSKPHPRGQADAL